MLQDGTKQVLAGYVLYGSSTMLVYSTGNGVNGFTLDPESENFSNEEHEVETGSTQTPQELLEYGYQKIKKDLSQELLSFVKQRITNK